MMKRKNRTHLALEATATTVVFLLWKEDNRGARKAPQEGRDAIRYMIIYQSTATPFST
jgi:hypothetical protein